MKEQTKETAPWRKELEVPQQGQLCNFRYSVESATGTQCFVRFRGFDIIVHIRFKTCVENDHETYAGAAVALADTGGQPNSFKVL